MNDESRAPAPVSGRGWRVTGLHHVAFAHADARTGTALGTVLGLHCEQEEAAEGFVERTVPVGDSAIQLLQAYGPGLIGTFVDRRGPALHHVALAVDDIDAATADLCSTGVEMVDRVPRPGGMGTRVVFAHPRAFAGLLVELVEPRA